MSSTYAWVLFTAIRPRHLIVWYIYVLVVAIYRSGPILHWQKIRRRKSDPARCPAPPVPRTAKLTDCVYDVVVLIGVDMC